MKTTFARARQGQKTSNNGNRNHTFLLNKAEMLRNCTSQVPLTCKAFGFGEENTNPDLGILNGILLLRSKIEEWIMNQKNAHSKWIQQIKVMICSQLSISKGNYGS